MRTTIVAGIVIVLAIRLLAWAWSAPVEAQGQMPEALITVAPTATALPAPTPTLAQLGTPVRVQFDLGTYGTTLQVQPGQTTYALWARQGQAMTILADRPFAVRMTAPGGADVPFDGGRAILPEIGDYLLTVAGEGFALSIDIR